MEIVTLCVFAFYRQLITHLKVFSKFLNPRSVYLESSLSELYNQVKHNPHQPPGPPYWSLKVTSFIISYLCLIISNLGAHTYKMLVSVHSCCAIRTRISSEWRWNVFLPTETPTSCRTSKKRGQDNRMWSHFLSTVSHFSLP